MMNSVRVNRRQCKVEGCEKPLWARGICRMHYGRWERHGDTNALRVFHFLSFSRPDELKKMLLNHRTITSDGCWEWTRTRTSEGYGNQTVDGRVYRVSRLSKALFHGFDLNSPLLMCHHCDNPPCFNPNHLFPGTDKDNSEDCRRKGRPKGAIKLTPEKVRSIRAERLTGATMASLGQKFGVSASTICHVVHRRDWQFVNDKIMNELGGFRPEEDD